MPNSKRHYKVCGKGMIRDKNSRKCYSRLSKYGQRLVWKILSASRKNTARCPKGYLRNTGTNRCHWVGKKGSKRRPGPEVKASGFALGTRHKGRDGLMWRVVKSGKTKRWVHVRQSAK